MSSAKLEKISIKGIACCLPEHEVLNTDLKKTNKQNLVDSIEKTGINKRRVCSAQQEAKGLALSCSKDLLNHLDWEKESIDVLIYLSQSSTKQYPGDANWIKATLGLENSCIALDINIGCSAMPYGLFLLGKLLDGQQHKRGLILIADELSKHIDKKDFATKIIFSDAASAIALEWENTSNAMLFNLESDGKDFNAISKDFNQSMKMNGLQVFQKCLTEVPNNFNALLEEYKISKSAISSYCLHQANQLLNEAIIRKLNISQENCLRSLDEFGNTSGSTIPVSLCFNRENIDKEKYIALLGFGVGMSWASCLVKLKNCSILPIKFVE